MGLRDEGLRESLRAQGLKQGGLRGSVRNLNSTGPDIPDSVVSRPDDDFSDSNNGDFGVRISSSEEWPEIGGRLSANVSGATRAYIYRVSDSTLIGDADISGLSGGDAFTIDLSDPAISGENYNFVLDAEGSSYTLGKYTGSTSYPYTSSDGNLEIISGASGASNSVSDPHNIVEVGNVGFD